MGQGPQSICFLMTEKMQTLGLVGDFSCNDSLPDALLRWFCHGDLSAEQFVLSAVTVHGQSKGSGQVCIITEKDSHAVCGQLL